MKLYDKVIRVALSSLEKAGEPVITSGSFNWPDGGDCNLIMKKDMAYELGGGNLAAVSGLFFTSDASLVPFDQVVLYGDDLGEISQDRAYARLTFVRVCENDDMTDDEEVYGAMRKVEYTRYHVNPLGYMMRISAANHREPVRVSKESIANGIDFNRVGGLFINGYHKSPWVEAVKTVFVTLPEFPYDELRRLSEKSEEITTSLNHIFNNLVMDCSVCNLKPVCDQVEGMREVHMNLDRKRRKE